MHRCQKFRALWAASSMNRSESVQFGNFIMIPSFTEFIANVVSLNAKSINVVSKCQVLMGKNCQDYTSFAYPL